MSPTTGVRRSPCTRANARGKRPSSAAAIETRAVSMIQPFRAPRVAAMATRAIHLPQLNPRNVPPQIAFAASANGADEPASAACDRTPTIATNATT